MARSLEPELTITDWDKPGSCELCGSPKRDPGLLLVLGVVLVLFAVLTKPKDESF